MNNRCGGLTKIDIKSGTSTVINPYQTGAVAAYDTNVRMVAATTC